MFLLYQQHLLRQVQYPLWACMVEQAFGGVLLADEMGLGRTVQALCHILQHAAENGGKPPTLHIPLHANPRTKP